MNSDGGKIDGVFLKSAQPERLASWYAETLGVTTHASESGTTLTGPDDAATAVTWDLSVVVTDLAAARERLLDAGADFSVTDQGDVLVRDPAGHLLRLHALSDRVPAAPVVPDGITVASDEPESAQPTERRVPARALAFALGAVVIAGLAVVAISGEQDTPVPDAPPPAAAQSLTRSENGPAESADLPVYTCEVPVDGLSSRQGASPRTMWLIEENQVVDDDEAVSATVWLEPCHSIWPR